MFVSGIYKQFFHVRWNETDSNGHMRNSAYLDMASDVRMMFFRDNNITAKDFERLRVGPVVMKDEIEYFREMKLMDSIEVTMENAGMAPDGSRFRIRNCYFRQDGKLSVSITSTVGWLNLDARRLIMPPESILGALEKLTRTDDYAELPSSIK
jgi:acyl-CoA thioester hydrolase